jgi:hypothetical protein
MSVLLTKISFAQQYSQYMKFDDNFISRFRDETSRRTQPMHKQKRTATVLLYVADMYKWLLQSYLHCLLRYYVLLVGVEVLTTAFMNSTSFCDITPYSPYKVNRRFRETCQDRKISQARNQRETTWKAEAPLLTTCFHAGILRDLFFDPEDGGDMFLQNVR